MSLDRDSDDDAGRVPDAAARPMLDRVGPYRIVSVLGEGGMGIVYLAEQREPVQREVALKVLRSGSDTDEIIARFKSERQTLALMEHPNITHVYDAGATEDGLPYFAMERVDGVPITDYATAHRMTTRERVKLIIQVCRALQHAHQKGIIHRDIKPSNVLVMESDGAPLCKVIDFGISKATAAWPGSLKITGTGMVIGTPSYMSPEQFMGDAADIDTRSDIYSVGVVLYELIAGMLPFSAVQSGRRSMLGSVASGDVTAPSVQYAGLDRAQRQTLADERRTDPATLRRTMTGDLDCITIKTLENARDQRYATANALAADLEHYLADEPVSARASTARYRASKFVRRHRLGVTFAATLLSLLIAVAIGASIQARRLAVANATARARQGQAEELIGFMLGDVRDRLQPIGKLDILDTVGAKALAYFAAVPESQLSGEELYRRAQAIRQLGNVRLSQGKLPEAARLMQQSVALMTPLVRRDSLNPRWQLGLAHNLFWAGTVDWARGNVDSALAHFLPLVQISDRLLAQYPDSLAYRAEVGYALNNIGFAKEAKGDARAALASYEAAMAIFTPLVPRDTTKVNWIISLSALHNAAGVARRKIGDLDGALKEHVEELAIKERLAGRDTANREWQRYIALAHLYLSDIRLWRGDAEGALADALVARGIFASLVAHDTANVAWKIGMASSIRRTGIIRLERGDAASALREFDAGAVVLAHFPAANAGNAAHQLESMGMEAGRARALTRVGRAAEARTSIEPAIALGEATLAKRPRDLGYRKALAEGYLAYGEVLSRPAQTGGATTRWARALVLVDSLARASKETDVLALQASAMLQLGGRDDARPAVGELAKRGYRRPSYVALVRANGL